MTVKTQQGNFTILQFDTVAAMVATEANFLGQRVYCKNYDTDGDGGGGYFQAITTTTPDGGINFTGVNETWRREVTDTINARWFGCDGTNDAADLIAAILYCNGNTRTLLIDFNISIELDVTVTAGVDIRFEKNGKITIATTKTLTLNRVPIATPHEIFDGAGVTLFNIPGIIWLNWFATSAKCFGSSAATSSVYAGSTVMIQGEWDIGVKGRIVSYVPVTVSGTGWGLKDDSFSVVYGTIITNTGGDVVDASDVIEFAGRSNAKGSSPRYVGIRNSTVKDLAINNDGNAAFGIKFGGGIFNTVENVFINCNNTGFGGVTTAFPTAFDPDDGEMGAFFSQVRNTQIVAFTDFGILFDGNGSAHSSVNCYIGSGVNGAVGIETRQQGTLITEGQINCSGAGGIPVRFYNDTAVTLNGGTVRDVLFESAPKDSYSIVVDGNTRNFDGILIANCRWDAKFNAGGLFRFNNTSFSNVVNPIVRNEDEHGTTGDTTTTSASLLIASGATFSADGVQAGWVVKNRDDTGILRGSTWALVVSVDSETQLTLDTDIFTAGGAGEAFNVSFTGIGLFDDGAAFCNISLDKEAAAVGYILGAAVSCSMTMTGTITDVQAAAIKKYPEIAFGNTNYMNLLFNSNITWGTPSFYDGLYLKNVLTNRYRTITTATSISVKPDHGDYLKIVCSAAINANPNDEQTPGDQLRIQNDTTSSHVVTFDSTGMNFDIPIGAILHVMMGDDRDTWKFIGLYSNGAATYSATNVSIDRTFDADTVGVAELADVVGTLIADLRVGNYIK